MTRPVVPSREIQSPSLEGLSLDAHLLFLFVHDDLAGSGDAALAHAAGDDGGVRGHAAARGENAGCDLHAVDVFRRGFAADEDDGLELALAVDGDGFIGGEDDLADGGAGRCGQALGEDFDLASLLVETGDEEVVELVGLDAEDGFFLGDESFFDHVDGDLDGGQTGALAVAGLQHVELGVLNGELEVLHVAVVLFHARGDVAQLVVDLGHHLFELGDVDGGAHAADHVFALGVEQELAVELLGAGGGIAGEADAGAGGVSHVAEDHGLHVDGGAEHVVDVVHAAIVAGAIVLPGAEDGVAGHDELVVGVLREVDFGVLLDHLFVFGDDFLQGLGVEFGVELGLLLLLFAVEDLFEVSAFRCRGRRCRTSG